jgi:hypothetical protein
MEKGKEKTKMFLKALAPIIRLIGLVALFWTHWIVAVILIVFLGITALDDYPGKEPKIRNTKVRITVEIIAGIVAVAGIWFFPLIQPTTAHIAAVIAAVLTFVSFVGPFAGLDKD